MRESVCVSGRSGAEDYSCPSSGAEDYSCPSIEAGLGFRVWFSRGLCAYVCAYTCTCVCVHACVQYVYVSIHAYIHTRIHTYACTHTHTHTHMHTCIYVCMYMYRDQGYQTPYQQTPRTFWRRVYRATTPSAQAPTNSYRTPWLSTSSIYR